MEMCTFSQIDSNSQTNLCNIFSTCNIFSFFFILSSFYIDNYIEKRKSRKGNNEKKNLKEKNETRKFNYLPSCNVEDKKTNTTIHKKSFNKIISSGAII